MLSCCASICSCLLATSSSCCAIMACTLRRCICSWSASSASCLFSSASSASSASCRSLLATACLSSSTAFSCLSASVCVTCCCSSSMVAWCCSHIVCSSWPCCLRASAVCSSSSSSSSVSFNSFSSAPLSSSSCSQRRSASPQRSSSCRLSSSMRACRICSPVSSWSRLSRCSSGVCTAASASFGLSFPLSAAAAAGPVAMSARTCACVIVSLSSRIVCSELRLEDEAGTTTDERLDDAVEDACDCALRRTSSSTERTRLISTSMRMRTSAVVFCSLCSSLTSACSASLSASLSASAAFILSSSACILSRAALSCAASTCSSRMRSMRACASSNCVASSLHSCSFSLALRRVSCTSPLRMLFCAAW